VWGLQGKTAGDIYSAIWVSRAPIAGGTPSPRSLVLQKRSQLGWLPGAGLCAGS